MADADPTRIHTLCDLKRELDLLRRAEGRRQGMGWLSLRSLVRPVREHRGREVPRSTLDNYLSGRTLAPHDVYEAVLAALGVDAAELGPWADAWDRLDDARRAPSGRDRSEPAAATAGQQPAPSSPAPANRQRKLLVGAVLGAAVLLAGGTVAIVGAGSHREPPANPERALLDADGPKATECTYKIVGAPVRVHPGPHMDAGQRFYSINIVDQPVHGSCQPTRGVPGTDTCGIGDRVVDNYIHVRFPYPGWIFQPCLQLVHTPAS